MDADAGERASEQDVHRDRDEAGRSGHRLRHGERLRSEGRIGHVFRTTDFGAHWTNVSANLPNAPVNAIEVDWRTSPATLYAATDVGVFWSQSGGLSWNNTSVGMPSLMVVDVKLDPVADKLLAATHGRGMYVAPRAAGATTRALGLTKSGSGAGTVTSAPAGIDCGSSCAYDFDTGTPVTLDGGPAAAPCSSAGAATARARACR